MKLKVTIRYGDQAEMVNKLPVGDGRKPFKWLGLIAAQRFSQRAPRGYLRRRERPGVVPHGSCLLPVRISSSEEVVYHPDQLIVDHLCDGESVTVELGHSVRVDSSSSRLALEAFPLVGFFKNAVPEEERSQAWAAVQLKADRRKNEEAARQEAEREQQREVKAQEMRVVLGLTQAGGEVAETWRFNTFQRVWGALSASRGLHALLPPPRGPINLHDDDDDDDEDDEQLERLRTMLLRDFNLLYEVFCRSCSEDSDARLSLPEFVRLVHALQLPHKASLSLDMLTRIFLDSDCTTPMASLTTHGTTTMADDPASLLQLPALLPMSTTTSAASSTMAAGAAALRAVGLELDMAGFLLSLAHLALGQFVDPLLAARLPQLSLVDVRRRRQVLSALAPEAVPSLTQALARLLTEHVQPYARDHLIDVLIKQTACSTEVLASLANYHVQLQRVFFRWAGKPRTGFGLPSLSFFNFRELLLHCGLIASEHDVRSIRAAKSAFIACRKEEGGPSTALQAMRSPRRTGGTGTRQTPRRRNHPSRRNSHQHSQGHDDGSSSGGGGSSSVSRGGQQPEEDDEPEEDEEDYEGVSLTFPEFFEAIVRMGVHHFSDPRVPMSEKMLHTVHLIVGGVEKH